MNQEITPKGRFLRIVPCKGNIRLYLKLFSLLSVSDFLDSDDDVGHALPKRKSFDSMR